MPAIAAERVDVAKRRLREDGAGRVVRRDRHHRARAGRDRGADRVDVQLIARIGRDEDRTAAGHLNGHLVVEIERHRQDDFVARLGDREHRVDERHVGAGRHHDAAAARDIDAVVAPELAVRSRRRAPAGRKRADSRACSSRPTAAAAAAFTAAGGGP